MPVFDFRRYPVMVTNNFDPGKFPIKFANEIFVYRTNNFLSFNYLSPVSIKFVNQGTENYYFNNKKYLIKKNQALIVNDQNRISSRMDTPPKGEINEGMSIFLQKDLILEVLEVINSKPGSIPEFSQSSNKNLPFFYDEIIRDDASMLKYFKNLFEYLSQNNYSYLDDSIYYGIAEQLMFTERHIHAVFEKIKKVRYSTKKEIFTRISFAKEIIDELGTRHFNLDFVSRECALSKFFLIKCFKQVFNQTPYEYYISKKIEKAKDLLHANKLSISEISSLLGYPNIYSFSRQFKNVSGYCPTFFKRMTV